MKRLIYILIIVSFLYRCSSKKRKYQSQKKHYVEFAQNFNILKSGDKTFVFILNPEKKTIEKKFYTNKNEPNTIWIDNNKYKSNSIISFSSTFIGLLDKLNEISRIKGIDDKKLIHNKKIIKNVNRNLIKELGSIESVSLLKIINSKAELIFYSGFGHDFPNYKKLKKLNILSLPIYDWKETHPLGKAEWIKVFGIITNKEKEATIYFNKLKERYLKLKNKYKHNKLSEPLFSGSIIGDFWYLPAGGSYLARLFKDARINYVEQKSKGTGSISKSLEYCLKNYRKSKYWLNPGNRSIDLLVKQNEKYHLFDALNNSYCYSHKPNLYWEKSAIEPDSLLMDLIQISHPELKLKRKLYFYKKLN